MNNLSIHKTTNYTSRLEQQLQNHIRICKKCRIKNGVPTLCSKGTIIYEKKLEAQQYER